MRLWWSRAVVPDVTSTLLAMYQQVVGGSSAREQSACEAEAARRVIRSGLTIDLSGNIFVTNLFATTLNTAALGVTGNITVNGTASVASLVVSGTALVQGLLTATAGLSVTGATVLTGTLAVSSDTTVGGTLTVTGAGPHQVVAGATGPVVLRIRNTQAGTANLAALYVGNDGDPNLLVLQAFASTYTATASALPNGAMLYVGGVGGFSLVTQNAPIRFSTNSAERLRIAATGEVLINNTSNPLNVMFHVAADVAVHTNLAALQNLGAATCNFLLFLNNANGLAGAISQVNATTVNYGTTSDARLKDDGGRATDVAALRAVVVHDFTWKADGRRARGVFAQEAHAVFPAAITEGADETTDDGSLARPWMTDYSKFVPDLIVGWQQHEAELVTLRALLALERMH